MFSSWPENGLRSSIKLKDVNNQQLNDIKDEEVMDFMFEVKG